MDDLNALAAKVAKLRLDLNEARETENTALIVLDAAQKASDAKYRRHLAAWKELDDAVRRASGEGERR